MPDVTITLSQNGSLKVEGPIRLVNEEGKDLSTKEGKPVFLCRCGGSSNKPFCDGTHKSIGFMGA